jgi:signal transduction histidine kinase
MASSETNGERQPAGCRGRDGRLWFPTIQGVVVVNPADVPTHEASPTIALEGITIDGQLHAPTTREAPFVIPPGGGQVMVFRYTLPTFVNPERAQFRYRLVGLKDEWFEAGEQRVAYFTNLKPDDYEFQVMGATAHGIWCATSSKFAFRIEPKFTQTNWYPLSWGGGILGVVVACSAWRLKWQRAADASAQALKLEQERARIAADLHDELGSKLTALSLRSRGSAIEHELRHTAERLRELVWAVDPKSDSLEGLVGYLVDESERLLGSAGINLDLDIPTPIPRVVLAAGVRRQLALVVQEALTNAVRHSGAVGVRLSLKLEDHRLIIQVVDDGHGQLQERPAGRGLGTMRSRMESIGGGLRIVGRTAAPHGVSVEAWMPLQMDLEVTHG